jgi:flagellar motor switch protein FliM
LGLIAISQLMLAAMIEVQTMGRLSKAPPVARKPTRTDAAMSASFIDTALRGFEGTLAGAPDLAWAGGFRYASFLDDPRPLGLLLDDMAYRVFEARIEMAEGTREGAVFLALPAEGKGPAPAGAPNPMADVMAARVWAADLTEQVYASETELVAVLHRLTVPLQSVMGLKPGDLVPLAVAGLDRVQLIGSDGRRVSEGKLGQQHGMRALRLTAAPQTEVAPRQVPPLVAAG